MYDPKSQFLAPQELLLLSLSVAVKSWLFLLGCNPIYRPQKRQVLQSQQQKLPLLSLALFLFCLER